MLFLLDLDTQFAKKNNFAVVCFSLAERRECLRPAPTSLLHPQKQSQELKRRQQHVEVQNSSVFGAGRGRKSKRTEAEE